MAEFSRKVVVTGVEGQLGREWACFLTDKQVDYVGLGSSELDITDKTAVDTLLGQIQPDVVINCAAFTDVDGAEEAADKAYRVNSDGVELLAEWCFTNNAKMIHYSTDYVFSGNTTDREHFPDGYPEDADKAPQNVYGASKLSGEMALIESGAAFLLIRVSWLCGRFGSNFVSTMLRLGKERTNLTVVDDQFGSPSFTDNVVANSYLLLSHDESGIWHISSQGLVNWYEFATEIFKQKGLSVQITPVSSDEFVRRATRPAFSKLSTARLEALTYSKLESWDEGLVRLLRSMRQE